MQGEREPSTSHTDELQDEVQKNRRVIPVRGNPGHTERAITAGTGGRAAPSEGRFSHQHSWQTG